MMRLKMFKTSIPVILSLVMFSMLILTQDGHAQGSAAGKVVFVMGTPQAIDSAGTARNLVRGDAIYSGDRLVTGRGRLQVNMADGAFISVQPNSEYILDNYNYSGQPDGTEQAVYRLAKGGVRAVTGLIGRTNKEAYKVNTAVATIGIRGTGHNTRLCAGDCGSGVKDGLYHNTWEGITYVVNDVDSEDVPTGEGVYVERIDTEILPLDQASGVTAAVTRIEEIREDEEETRDVEEQTTLVATGDQRNPDGDQIAVVGDGVLTPTQSESISGLGVLGVHSEDDSVDGVDVFGLSDASVLVDPDEKIIGIIGLDDNGTDPGTRGFGTINLNAALGVDDPALQAEITGFVGLLDSENMRLFLEDPAEAVESTLLGNSVGFGRWANGRFLATDDDGTIFTVEELVDFQSLHFIFGPLADPVPALGTASYQFVDGTRSTSRSGASIGNGVTGGNISVNFGAGTAQLSMDVDHNGNLYLVSGPLALGVAENSLMDAGVYASATLAGSACNPMCSTYIEGGFVGDIVSGVPEYIGLEYEIQETDIILGVAAFSATGGLIQSFVTKPMVLIAVQPSVDFLNEADITVGIDGAIHFDANGKVIGAIITQFEEDPLNPTGPEIQARSFGTIDLEAMKNSDDLGARTELDSLITAGGAALATAIADFESNPASVTDSYDNGVVGFGRWTNGKVLTYNDNFGAEVDTLTGNQSLHFIYGQEPDPLPTTGMATYNFVDGTQSTSVSGATIGNGVMSGSISVIFSSTPSANLNMVVDHVNPDNTGGIYNINGSLEVGAPEIHDLSVSATGGTGNCMSGCTTFIDGGFAGPTNVTGPAYIGIEYDINETDIITGVAGFAN